MALLPASESSAEAAAVPVGQVIHKYIMQSTLTHPPYADLTYTLKQLSYAAACRMFADCMLGAMQHIVINTLHNTKQTSIATRQTLTKCTKRLEPGNIFSLAIQLVTMQTTLAVSATTEQNTCHI